MYFNPCRNTSPFNYLHLVTNIWSFTIKKVGEGLWGQPLHSLPSYWKILYHKVGPHRHYATHLSHDPSLNGSHPPSHDRMGQAMRRRNSSHYAHGHKNSHSLRNRMAQWEMRHRMSQHWFHHRMGQPNSHEHLSYSRKGQLTHHKIAYHSVA